MFSFIDYRISFSFNNSFFFSGGLTEKFLFMSENVPFVTSWRASLVGCRQVNENITRVFIDEIKKILLCWSSLLKGNVF